MFKQAAPSSSQKEGGKDTGKYRQKEHTNSGRDRFPDKERSHSGTFRDKNRERDIDRTRDVDRERNREKNRNRDRDTEKDRAREKDKGGNRDVGNRDRGPGGSGWRFSPKDAPEREKGKVDKKNDSRTGDQTSGSGGDKGSVPRGDVPSAAGKSSGDEGKKQAHNAENMDMGADADGKGKQRVRYKVSDYQCLGTC